MCDSNDATCIKTITLRCQSTQMYPSSKANSVWEDIFWLNSTPVLPKSSGISKSQEKPQSGKQLCTFCSLTLSTPNLPPIQVMEICSRLCSSTKDLNWNNPHRKGQRTWTHLKAMSVLFRFRFRSKADFLQLCHTVPECPEQWGDQKVLFSLAICRKEKDICSWT